MKKQIFSIFLTLAMLLSVLAVAWIPANAASPEATDEDTGFTADADWYENETTDDDPDVLHIYNAADFIAFGTKLGSAGAGTVTAFSGKVVKLEADIDMSGAHDVEGFNWFYAKRGRGFAGIFDGNGHKISGFDYMVNDKTNANNTDCGIIAGYLIPHSAEIAGYGAYAGIFNLTIENSSVTSGAPRVGALVGSIRAGNKVVIQNVTIDNVKIDQVNGQDNTGALVGNCYKNSHVEFNNCIVKNTTVTSNGTFVAGITPQTGAENTTINVNNCMVEATLVVSKSGNCAAGGLIGVNNATATINNSVFCGTIHNENTSGAVGKMGGLVASTEGSLKLTINHSASYTNFKYYGGDDEISVSNTAILVGVRTSKAHLELNNVIGSGQGALYVISEPEGATGTFVKTNAVKATSAVTKGMEATLTATDSESGETADLTPYFIAIPGHCPIPTALIGSFRAEIGTHHATAMESGVTRASSFQTTDYVDGECALRIVGLLNGDTTAFSAVGYEIHVIRENGKKWTNLQNGVAPSITTVYTSVIAKGEPKTAADLNGDYIFVATVNQILQNKGVLTIVVKTFHDDNDGVRTYDDISVFDFDTGSAA